MAVFHFIIKQIVRVWFNLTIIWAQKEKLLEKNHKSSFSCYFSSSLFFHPLFPLWYKLLNLLEIFKPKKKKYEKMENTKTESTKRPQSARTTSIVFHFSFSLIYFFACFYFFVLFPFFYTRGRTRIIRFHEIR